MPNSVGLSDRYGDRPAGMDELGGITRDRLSSSFGSIRPSVPSTGAKPRAAGEILGRAALVPNRMRLAMAEADAARAIEEGERSEFAAVPVPTKKTATSRSKISLNFSPTFLSRVAVAIGGVKSAGVASEAFGDLGMGAGPVV